MIEFGFDKMALIGVVALIVIGPEKLPRVARTMGTLLGKAQRYVSDVKAEVNRSIELDELKKMKETMESAARDVQTSVESNANELQRGINAIGGEISADGTWTNTVAPPEQGDITLGRLYEPDHAKAPKKNWRAKQAAVPNWYKARSGVRTRALSGAARVARFRPRKSA